MTRITFNIKHNNNKISSNCVCELTDLAGFAGTAPSGSQCGAALRLQRGSVDVDLTAVVLYCQPARTLHTVCGTEVTQTTFIVSHNNMSCNLVAFKE